MHQRGLLLLLGVIGTAACTDDALCADDVTTVNVRDFFEDGNDGVTVTRDDFGMVTLIARERGGAVQATFPTDVDIDDVVGEVQLTVGSTGTEGIESDYLTVVDERGVLFTGGRHPTFDDSKGGGYDADSPFTLGEATGTRCDGNDHYAVRIAFDDGAVDVDVDNPVSGTLRGVSMRAQAMGAWKRSFFATEYVADGYDIGPHTEGNMVAWAWRTR